MNLVLHTLTSGIDDSSDATSVYVLHDTVYMAISGYAQTLAIAANSEYLVTDRAGNSTEIGLTDVLYTPGLGFCTGITAQGTDLYISGSEYEGINYQPCYWKNGSINSLRPTPLSATRLPFLRTSINLL